MLFEEQVKMQKERDEQYEKERVDALAAYLNTCTKTDSGKPDLTKVPKEIISGIEKVRVFGKTKYPDPEAWREVSPDVYHRALLRHILQMWEYPFALDEESGLPTIYHVAFNVAALCYNYDQIIKGEDNGSR